MMDQGTAHYRAKENILPKFAIQIDGLRKVYAARGKSSEKVAIESIDLHVPRGSIFGLLGPNGAGKSTLINIMAGLVLKTAGSVKIWDTDIDQDARQSRANIGIVPQEINYDPFFSPFKLLDLQAGLYGVPKAARRTAELLDLVGLADKAHAYTRTLSGGMRRRLMVAKAMVHNPPILVLDEPTAGVDVELREQLWQNIKALNARGVTVMLTTHYLEEAEQLCDHIAIIHKGRIVANEQKETLLNRIEGRQIRFRLVQDIVQIPDPLLALGAEQEGRRTLMFRYAPKDQVVDGMIQAILAAGFAIEDISTDEQRLEDVFRAFTR